MKMAVLSLVMVALLAVSGCMRADPGFNVLVNDDGDSLSVDTATNAVVTADVSRNMLNNGYMFTVMESTDLSNSAIRNILVVTPDTDTWAHLFWTVAHELEAKVEFYADTAYSANGTEISSFNRDGNVSANATTLVFHTPTITDAGTLVATAHQGGGQKAGGGDHEASEFILKQGSAYLLRITNATTSDNLIYMKLAWYEYANQGEG